MKLSLKIYLTIIYIFSASLVLIAFNDYIHQTINFDLIVYTICLVALMVFVNQKFAEDSNTKVSFIVVTPLLLPALVELPNFLLYCLVFVSYYFIYLDRPLIKRLYNISTSIISVFLLLIVYRSFTVIKPEVLTDSQLYFVISILVSGLLFNIITSLFVYVVISIDKGDFNKNTLLPFLILSKSALVNVFLGILNVYIYSYLGIIGLILSTFLIFALKPVLYHYISQNNDLTAHTRLILTMLKHKDPSTYDHSNRVRHWTTMIAKKLKMSQTEIYQLSQAASWHDIGKIELDTEVLVKEGKLTDEEFDLVKQHPELGYQMVKDLTYFKKFLDVIRYHHERMDGKGYPHGLQGQQIPYHARIICVADSFDAMTMDRPYREGMSMCKAVEELVRCSGTQFDPQIVKVFIEALKEEYGNDYERWSKDSFVSA